MNQLLSFYYGSHPDHKGRMLAEIVQQDDHWLESTHDYIQWLFPLDAISRASSHAPIVDGATIKAFHTDELLQKHMRVCLVRMLKFSGLRFDGQTLQKSIDWHQNKDRWFTVHSHNSLRITRILKSMALLGLKRDAVAIHQGIEMLCTDELDCGITDESRQLWRQAVE